jgi:transcriptional regulator with XRE-family HTH domain
MFTNKTCRAARALLEWSQIALARKAGVGVSTVINFEKDHHKTEPENVAALQGAFEAAGIEFTNGDGMGVRLVPKKRTARK